MDFRQLEAFIATVDHQSFSAAAEALYLSQPTISSYIHSLERELNTQLIRRTTKKFEVTVNGQQLYEYAVALLRLQQKAITEHKSNINYVNAVDMKLEALSEEEEKQMAADEQADAAKEEAMAETAAQMDELTDNAIKELKEKGIL